MMPEKKTILPGTKTGKWSRQKPEKLTNYQQTTS